MKENKNEQLEEKVERNTKHIWWLTIVMVVLLVAAALGGYLVGASRIANEVVEQKENASEEQVLKVTNEVKDKIERFVEIGSYFDYSGNNTMEFFTKGTTDISKEILFDDLGRTYPGYITSWPSNGLVPVSTNGNKNNTNIGILIFVFIRKKRSSK